jgi:hypothetical protein
MATRVNTPLAGEIWHLSIEDLFTPVQEAQRLGGDGPFVISLSVSTAPINVPKKPFDCCPDAHIYQIQVNEDGRTRYRLRLGPFVFEDDADAVLQEVREIYPAALTATACALDVRTIESMQAKVDSKRPQSRKPGRAAAEKAAADQAAAEIAAAEKAVADSIAAERAAQQHAAERLAAERAAAERAAQKLAAERAAAERALQKLAAEKLAAERAAAERAAAERAARQLAAERAAAERLAAERAAAERAAQKLAAEKLAAERAAAEKAAAEKAAAERAAAERAAAERAAQKLAAERAAAERLAAERAAAERAAQKLAAEKLAAERAAAARAAAERAAAERAAAERAAAERAAAERAAQRLAAEKAAAEKAAAEKAAAERAAAERAAQRLAAEKAAAEKAAAEKALAEKAAQKLAAERAAAEKMAAEKAAAARAAAERAEQKRAAEKLVAEVSIDIGPTVPKAAPLLTDVVARILKTKPVTDAAVPAPLLTEMVKPGRKGRAPKVAAAPVGAEFATRVIVVPAPKLTDQKAAILRPAASASPASTVPVLSQPAVLSQQPAVLAAMQPTIVATAAVPAAREVKQLNEPLPDLESTQTVRALTPPELEDHESSRWFVIQLALADHAFDPEAVPNLDIFSEYRLYSVAGLDQGRTVHALRLGFFTEEIAAVMVASYLGAHYNKPTIRRVSVAERERFAHQRVEARKDVGETGTHAVIEITDELVARRKRIAAAALSETASFNIGQSGLFPSR